MRIRFSIPNLSYHKKRKQATIANLLDMKVPKADIDITDARSGLKYLSATDMWNDVKDTLTYLKDATLSPERLGCGDIGYMWSCFDILDNFLPSDYDYLYFNQDDWGLTLPYPKLVDVLKQVLTINPKFKLIKLMYNYDFNNQHPNVTYPIGHGPSGQGDSGIILSKIGAADIRQLSIKSGTFVEYCVHLIKPVDSLFSATEPVFVAPLPLGDVERNQRQYINNRKRR